MFIPPGEIIHESLATSYVLLDALVADLCEGGFSGFVEVVLRDADSFIVIASGNVAAAFDKRGDGAPGGPISGYTRTTVEQLAECARRERGRVSVHSYSPETANAVAGRVNAKPLYVGLSTEFTDLEKMICKLVRESDREWFIEINTESEPAALIHVRDTECRVVGSTGHTDSGALDLASNPVLGRLIYECNRARGTFDVYFTKTEDEAVDEPEEPAAEAISVAPPADDATAIDEPVESHLARFQYASSESLPADEFTANSDENPQEEILTSPDPGESDPELLEGPVYGGEAVPEYKSDLAPPAELEPPPPLTDDLIEPKAPDLSIVRDELPRQVRTPKRWPR